MYITSKLNVLSKLKRLSDFSIKGMSLGKFGKITVSWLAITVASLSLFVVAKNSINDRRLENMRARDRMRKSNEGQYPDVYRKF